MRSLYERKDTIGAGEPHLDAEDQKALEILNSLLEENEDILETTNPSKRVANLKIRSKRMTPLSKNRWLNLFLEMVQVDLDGID